MLVFKIRCISFIFYWFQCQVRWLSGVIGASFTRNRPKLTRVLSCVLTSMLHLSTKLNATTPHFAWREHLNYLYKKEVSIVWNSEGKIHKSQLPSQFLILTMAWLRLLMLSPVPTGKCGDSSLTQCSLTLSFTYSRSVTMSTDLHPDQTSYSLVLPATCSI